MRVMEIYEGTVNLPYIDLLEEVNLKKVYFLSTLKKIGIPIETEFDDIKRLGSRLKIETQTVDAFFDLYIKRVIRKYVQEEILFVAEDWRTPIKEKVVFLVYEKQKTSKGTERKFWEEPSRIFLINYFYTNQVFFREFIEETEAENLFRNIVRAKNPFNVLKKMEKFTSLAQKGKLPEYKEGWFFMDKNGTMHVDEVFLYFYKDCYPDTLSLPSIDYVESEIEYVKTLIEDARLKGMISYVFKLKSRLKKLENLKTLILTTSQKSLIT